MNNKMITPELPVADVLTTWPETLPLFLKHRMSCIGCYLSSFDTLGEALILHNLPVTEILENFNQIMLESTPED